MTVALILGGRSNTRNNATVIDRRYKNKKLKCAVQGDRSVGRALLVVITNFRAMKIKLAIRQIATFGGEHNLLA